MEATRRELFRFGAGAVLTVAASRLIGPSSPVLWADGIHDDTQALQAMLDGKPFDIAATAQGVVAIEGYLQGGTYLVSDTLHFRRNNLVVTEAEFVRDVSSTSESPAFMSTEGDVDCVIYYCRFVRRLDPIGRITDLA